MAINFNAAVISVAQTPRSPSVVTNKAVVVSIVLVNLKQAFLVIYLAAGFSITNKCMGVKMPNSPPGTNPTHALINMLCVAVEPTGAKRNVSKSQVNA